VNHALGTTPKGGGKYTYLFLFPENCGLLNIDESDRIGWAPRDALFAKVTAEIEGGNVYVQLPVFEYLNEGFPGIIFPALSHGAGQLAQHAAGALFGIENQGLARSFIYHGSVLSFLFFYHTKNISFKKIG
jgi:hypothetical protein